MLGIILAGLLTGLAAAALGKIILRLRGVYFVLVTFLAGQVFTLIALNWESVTHGANGLLGIPAISMFGFPLVDAPALLLLRARGLRSRRHLRLGADALAIWPGVPLDRRECAAGGIKRHRRQPLPGRRLLRSAAASPVRQARRWCITSASCRRTASPSTIRSPTSPCWSVGGRHTLIGGVLGCGCSSLPCRRLLRGFVGAQHIHLRRDIARRPAVPAERSGRRSDGCSPERTSEGRK